MAAAKSVIFVAGLALLGLATPPPATRLVIWNATASAPRGLYFVRSGPSRRGDLVLVTPPAWVAQIAATRGYLPAGVPLIKEIAAMSGDRICSDGSIIRINARTVAHRLAQDARGRALPGWTGCRTLDAGEELLLMAAVPASFDGRYFGPTPIANNLGRLVPLWTY